MKYFEKLSNLFDMLHHYMEYPKTSRRISIALVFIFIAGIIGIELNRRGWLPPALAKSAPTSHFQAANLAFTLILALEVMGLVFLLSYSMARSMGKQLEILTLIFLRDAFKEVSNLGEPINTAANMDIVLYIAMYGLTALLIFLCIGVYAKVQSSHSMIKNPMDRLYYVMCKKVISLFMFAAFVGVAAWGLYHKFVYGEELNFFESFYTILIFADILLVLVGQIFMPSFHAIFRSSGYVVSTMLMRLAMSAPVFYDCALGLFAAVFCVAMTWATTRFAPETVRKPLFGTNVDMTGREQM